MGARVTWWRASGQKLGVTWLWARIWRGIVQSEYYRLRSLPKRDKSGASSGLPTRSRTDQYCAQPAAGSAWNMEQYMLSAARPF